MKRLGRCKRNNAGYSLVEVIVALAIVTIAAIAVFEFAVVASKQYRKDTLETEVQYEAQLVMNQIQELLIDASEGVSYGYTGSGGTALILSDAEIGAGVTANYKYLTVYNDDKYYVLKWDPVQEKIFYSEYQNDGAGNFTQSVDEALMAEYVHAFSADISQLEQHHSVRLDVTFDNQRSYQVAQNVTLRNRVAVNKSISEVYAK